MTNKELVGRLLNSQAEVQVGLGMLRLGLANGSLAVHEAEVIEGYLARSLRMQQHILAKLGTQMCGGPAADDPDTECQA